MHEETTSNLEWFGPRSARLKRFTSPAWSFVFIQTAWEESHPADQQQHQKYIAPPHLRPVFTQHLSHAQQKKKKKRPFGSAALHHGKLAVGPAWVR